MKDETPKGLGTKAVLRSWLSTKHNLTHTAYTKLTPQRKAELYEEYQKARKPK